MSVLSMFGGVTRRLRPVNRDVVAHCRRRRLLQSDASRAGCHAELPGRHAARRRPATPGQQRRRVGPRSRRRRQLRRLHAAALSPGAGRRDSALQLAASFLRLRQ